MHESNKVAAKSNDPSKSASAAVSLAVFVPWLQRLTSFAFTLVVSLAVRFSVLAIRPFMLYSSLHARVLPFNSSGNAGQQRRPHGRKLGA